jgi:hypothetical protein
LKSKLVTERHGLYPTLAFDVNVTKITYPKKIVETVVISEPKVAIVFHAEYESGKSGTRRGIPANPKKCIGKKHKLTPIKVVQKCILPKVSS